MGERVLILSSSPRRGGNSDRLCDAFLEGARAGGHEADKVFLGDLDLHPCTGCGACLRTSRCVQKDAMAGLLARMVEADVLVLATPVYFYTMSAQMKMLIDRTCARYQELKDKQFCFIVTAADPHREALARTVDGFRGFTSCLDRPRELGTIFGTGVWEAGAIQGHPALEEAYQMGLSLGHARKGSHHAKA